jgi:integrase
MTDTTRFRFTKPRLEVLPLAEEGGRITYHDTHEDAGGLQLRVTSTSKTFFMQRRVNGKPERVTLGRFPNMTIEQARNKAKEVNATIATGKSPVAEKKRRKLEAKTLQKALDDYLGRRSLKPLTVKDMNNAFRQVCPDWLDRPLTRITGDMVVQRHQRYGAERSEARANLAMRYLRAIFSFAMAEYEDQDGNPIIKTNPAKKLSTTKAWHRVERRQTVIKPHELQAWVSAVQGLANHDMHDYLMTLLLTGLRREEALKLTWGDVDLAGKTVRVRDPKNRNDHTLPLSDYLHELFSRRQAVAVSDYVFAGSDGRRISNFRYTLANVEKISGVKATPHDLRRTFATIAESLDIPAYALKRLLNHATGADVTAGYVVTSTERLREPMQKITDYVLKAAGIKPTAEVITLKRSIEHEREFA